ncbi:MAG: hypothetical protein HY897_18050 [Deltaproteobacteria bacterium]|nr:hypothetical protein [Deltaproteobacteria bacterium]
MGDVANLPRDIGSDSSQDGVFAGDAGAEVRLDAGDDDSGIGDAGDLEVGYDTGQADAGAQDAEVVDGGVECDGGVFDGDVALVTRVEGNEGCLGYISEGDRDVVVRGSGVAFTVTLTNICAAALHISSPDLPPVSLCSTSHGTTCEYREHEGGGPCKFVIHIPGVRQQMTFDKDLLPGESYVEELAWWIPNDPNGPWTPPEGVYDVFTFGPEVEKNDGSLERVRFAVPLVLRIVAQQ